MSVVLVVTGVVRINPSIWWINSVVSGYFFRLINGYCTSDISHWFRLRLLVLQYCDTFVDICSVPGIIDWCYDSACLPSWAVTLVFRRNVVLLLWVEYFRPVFRNLFLTRDTPWFINDTWRHTTECRLTKKGHETIHGHKYKYLPYKNAGVWKQNIMHVG
jgi:hypothetical protein